MKTKDWKGIFEGIGVLPVAVLLAAVIVPFQPAFASCRDSAVALQILGSGGPFGYGRAASGYLVWVDGVARVMVDAGGGTFTRFHEAGAKIADLELIALSHFHPDHSAEVPALLWIKPTELSIAGPSGGNGYPSAREFVDGLFGHNGVFRAVTNGDGLPTITIDATTNEPIVVLESGQLTVQAIGVPHGIVPAVAYRVDVGDSSIVFSSDQNGSSPTFVDFASDVDVLVVHAAVPEGVTGFAADLHAKPSVWGQIATDANAGTLILSHLSSAVPRQVDPDLADVAARLGYVRSQYEGEIVIAEDLTCVTVN